MRGKQSVNVVRRARQLRPTFPHRPAPGDHAHRRYTSMSGYSTAEPSALHSIELQVYKMKSGRGSIRNSRLCRTIPTTSYLRTISGKSLLHYPAANSLLVMKARHLVI